MTRAQYDELVDAVENLVEQMEAIKVCNTELQSELEGVVAKNTALEDALESEARARSDAEARLAEVTARVDRVEDGNVAGAGRVEALATAIGSHGPSSWEVLESPAVVLSMEYPKVGKTVVDVGAGAGVSPGSWISGFIDATPSHDWGATLRGHVRVVSLTPSGAIYAEGGMTWGCSAYGFQGSVGPSLYFTLPLHPDTTTLALIVTGTCETHLPWSVLITRHGPRVEQEVVGSGASYM